MGLTRADLEAGWPDSFNVVRIAVLQRPYQWNKERMDTNGRALVSAYIDGLKAACAAQKIEHTADTKTVQPQQPRFVVQSPKSEYASESWLRRDGFLVSDGRISVKPATPKVVTTYTVTAPAFAAWLAAQGETPSPHVQAWFDAMGVAGAGQTDAPVDDANTAPPKDSPDDRNLRWLNEYEAEERIAHRGAYARASKRLGVESSTYRKAVDKARKARAERHRAGIKPVPTKAKATVFSGLGVTAVKDGKKMPTKQR